MVNMTNEHCCRTGCRVMFEYYTCETFLYGNHFSIPEKDLLQHNASFTFEREVSNNHFDPKTSISTAYTLSITFWPTYQRYNANLLVHFSVTAMFTMIDKMARIKPHYPSMFEFFSSWKTLSFCNRWKNQWININSFIYNAVMYM